VPVFGFQRSEIHTVSAMGLMGQLLVFKRDG
jgi:hypothetical protein